MKMTIWFEGQRYYVSGYRFLATCDKLYINDSLAKIEHDSKLIIDVWEIAMRKIKSEKNNMNTWTYVAEEIDLYTLPYLIVQNLAEEFGDNNTLMVKVAEE